MDFRTLRKSACFRVPSGRPEQVAIVVVVADGVVGQLLLFFCRTPPRQVLSGDGDHPAGRDNTPESGALRHFDGQTNGLVTRRRRVVAESGAAASERDVEAINVTERRARIRSCDGDGVRWPAGRRCPSRGCCLLKERPKSNCDFPTRYQPSSSAPLAPRRGARLR